MSGRDPDSWSPAECSDAVLLAVAWLRSIHRGELALADAIQSEPDVDVRLIFGLGCVGYSMASTLSESLDLDTEDVLDHFMAAAIEGVIDGG